MIEQRDFTPQELLVWCRFLSLNMVGAAMAYVREQEGAVDGLIEAMSSRLGSALSGMSGGGVEPAMLGLLLNVEALGSEVRSRSISPESGEIAVDSLPGQRLIADLEDRFEVALSQVELLSISGVERDELNRLFDLFGAIAAGGQLEFQRDEDSAATGTEQRLTLRVW
jgi:hypothetical protein